MFSDDICSDQTAVRDWNLCCVGSIKSWLRQRGGHKLFWEVQQNRNLRDDNSCQPSIFSQFSAVLKGWGGVIWVRMNYLNTPLIRLQVLIDAPTLFLTLLKEIFGILAGLIIFNVFEYLKLQLLNRYWNIYWLFDQTAVCRRKSKAIEKHFLSKFNDVLQRIHIHSHSRKVCIQVLSQNIRRRHK